MFSRVFSIINQYYFVPVLVTVPIKVATDVYYEYNTHKDNTFAEQTFCCFMGVWSGIVVGGFLGIAWPISLPIFISRMIKK